MLINRKNIVGLLLLLSGVITSGTTTAQSCNFSFADPITFNSVGAPAPGYTTEYILADATGIILDIQSSAAFPAGTTDTLVQAVAINYPSASAPSGITVGQSLFNISGCYDLSNHLWFIICGPNGTADIDCPFTNTGVIGLTSTGGNTAANYTTQYILASETGVILQVGSSSTLSAPSNGGVYECYAVNYLTSSGVTGLTVGQNVTDITGGCYHLGDYLGIIVCDPVVLPVQITAFEANKASKRTVALNWDVAAELNADGYIIERSTDLQSWQHIHWEPAAGATSEEQHYLTYDYQPEMGWNYYKLTQVDTDGQSTEHGIRSVLINESEDCLKIYPNPSNGEVTIELCHEGNGMIIDALGKQVMEVHSGNNRLHLAPGMYTVTSQVSGLWHHKRLIIMASE